MAANLHRSTTEPFNVRIRNLANIADCTVIEYGSASSGLIFGATGMSAATLTFYAWDGTNYRLVCDIIGGTVSVPLVANKGTPMPIELFAAQKFKIVQDLAADITATMSLKG